MAVLSSTARAELAALERRWSGSLAMQLLAHPLRKCLVTAKILPASLLLQLKPVHLPKPPSSSTSSSTSSSVDARGKRLGESGGVVVMMPDQLLHPKFHPRKASRGGWVTLDARMLAHAGKAGVYKAIHPRAVLPPKVSELVQMQLEQRTVQEAQLLHDRFAQRRKRLILPPADIQDRVAFSISEPQRQDTQDTQGAQAGSGLGCGLGAQGLVKPIFRPRFTDESHRLRFTQLLDTLARSSDDATLDVVHSPATTPLGIALYRLHLWTSSLTTT